MDTTTLGEPVRVGVLSHHNSKETKAILNAIEALGHTPVWIREENFGAHIGEDGQHIQPDVDVLANRLLLTKSENPLAKLRLVDLYATACPVLNTAPAVQHAIDKFRSAVHLHESGLPVPAAYLTTAQHRMDDWPTYIDGTAVQKPIIGTNGKHLYRIEPDEPTNLRLDGRQAFVQEYIEPPTETASDVRVYVVDGSIVGAMRRRAQNGEWRANVAQGATVEDVTHELDSEAQHIARDAVGALGLDYAGVDLIDDGTDWYVLEVNATAGFKGLFQATGRSVAPDIAKAAIERGGGSVDSTHVEELARTLDDSIPDCKPDQHADTHESVRLGYTNRVHVRGRTETDSVIAKSDTGAKRTSIDAKLAGRLGLGPITGTTTVRSGTTGHSKTRPLVELEARVGGRWQTTTASIADRGNMKYPMILGRDILEDYTLDIQKRVTEE